MIAIKDAVEAATKHLVALYGSPRGVQLEEIYLSDNELAWLVTLSFLAEADEEEVFSGPYGMIRQLSKELNTGAKRLVRKYKTLEVDANSGAVRSMKIRPVPSV